MFVHQQTNEEINRSLRQAEHDVISGADMTLPVKATRLGKILSFNARYYAQGNVSQDQYIQVS